MVPGLSRPVAITEEVENREGVLTEMAAIGWVVTMIGTFIAQAFAEYLL